MDDAVRPLIVFDGICHLCSGFVRFVLQRDADSIFDFASLQSDTARQRLTDRTLDSIALLEGDHEYRAEDAVLRILARLQRPWPLIAQLGRILPHPLTASGYRCIARRRYALFGHGDVCALPRPAWKGRFLA